MPKANRKKYRKILVFSAIGIAVAGLTVYAVFFRNQEAPITVQTEKVARRNLTELVVATGKIQPVTFVKISPEVSGEIIELPVKEGQQVKKGDLLLRIKPDTYIAFRNIAEASYQTALAQNTLAQANLTKAELEQKRYEDLFRNNLVSDSQYLEVKTNFEVAKASNESAKYQSDNARANLARAAEDLSKTTISSPLDGTISKLNSQLGERVVGTATYQGTEVMTISDLNDMEARVDIGEIDVVLIQVGQKARLEVDAFRDKKFNGAVSEIANTAKSSGAGSQQESTKFEVRIRISEKESFRPGMSVTSEIETRTRTNVLTVPIQSVTTRMPKEADDKKVPGKTTAAAKTGAQTNEASQANANTHAEAKTKDSATNTPATGKKANEATKPIEVVFLVNTNAVKMAKVTRGISDDSYVEITDGLTEGQEVVSGGYKAINRELEDGKKVIVDNTKKNPDKDDKSGSNK